jgi:hypothetical protein
VLKTYKINPRELSPSVRVTLEHYLGVQTLVIPMDSREHLHQRRHQVVLTSVVNATSRELRYETCHLDLLTFATPQSSATWTC